MYTCKSKDNKDITITILFEHKSYKPDNEYLQLIRYMLNIWEHQTKNKQALTPVIPVIFYHGDNEWNYREFFTFFDLSADNSLKQFIPDFKYVLTDITQYDDEVIKKPII